MVCMVLVQVAGLCQDPEFPRHEFIMHLKMHHGMVTRFKHAMPDLYTGGLQLVPQFTIVQNKLRLGAIADGFYTGKKLQGAIGATASFKLMSFDLKQLAGGGNLNVSLDHLWGTGNQRLFGGGINLDLLNLLVVGIAAHRDYHLNTWWLQGSIGFRISKVKQPPHP
jgi:hypothetical protein